MKKIIVLSLFIIAIATGAQAKGRKLLILHTNDTHSCIMPLKATLADTSKADRGGFIRRVEMIKEQRKNNPDMLLFDSGDFSQGSSYYTMFKGDVEVGLMNMMRYDAATIGNHEFDFGLENMARLFRMAKFPIVCANYDFTGTCVEGLVKPYTIIKRNGIKIGVFGLSPKMQGLVSDKNCKGVKFLDPTKSANEVVETLKMANTRNIDIVLGGHSHSFFKELKYVNNLDGISIPNDQNGKSGIYVGRITVDMKKKK